MQDETVGLQLHRHEQRLLVTAALFAGAAACSAIGSQFAGAADILSSDTVFCINACLREANHDYALGAYSYDASKVLFTAGIVGVPWTAWGFLSHKRADSKQQNAV